MSALDDLLKALDEALKKNKDSVDQRGIPLTGTPLSTYTSNANSANTDATSAMNDSYYDGLDSPTEIPSGGGATPYTDLLALCAAQCKAKYDASEDRQGQLDRLYTITQKYDDAIAEVQ